MDKHQTLRLRKIKRRMKRTIGRDSMHDIPPFLWTQKGKDALIGMGFREEDFREVY